MRILIFLIFLLICIDTSYSQQGWLHRTMGTANLVSINFVNETTGYMFRGNSYLLKSTNRGENWTESLINAGNVTIQKGMFLDNNIGIFLTRGMNFWSNNVFVTTNAGVNWNSSLPTSIGNLDLRSAIMINETTGFICGADAVFLDLPVDGIVYKTTNSGQSWQQSFRGGSYYTDVLFLNNDTGFVVQFPLLKTTNSGLNWFQFSDTERQRNSFSNVLGDTMYLSSVSGYIAKSTNLGATWTEYHTGTNKNLNDVYFIDNQFGYSVGDTGTIVKTTNGGINWTIQNSGTTKRLNEVWFLNKDTGFIAGDSGLLLITYNGGVTSLSLNHQSIPGQFRLYQNFPNPFNPSTKIQFDIERNSKVKISVYDISGKEIDILVNQSLSPGVYEYSFNASNLPSGIYFYKLETDNFTETKRMVLIK